MMTIKSLFYKYLLSYVLVGSIPLIILGVLLYMNAVTHLQSEITDFHLNKLDQARIDLDASVSGILQTAQQISTDAKLAPYAISEGYRPIETAALIKKYKDINPLISEIFLYYRNTDMLYTSSGSFSSDSFKQYMYTDYGWNKLYFLERLNEAAGLTIESPAAAGGEGTFDGANTIAIFIPIPLYSSAPAGVLAFAIRASGLTDIVHSVTGLSDSGTFILDQAGKFLAADNRSVQISEQRLLELIRAYTEPGIHKFEYEGSTYSFLLAKSEKTNWRLITLVPNSHLFHTVKDMQRFMLLLLLFFPAGAVLIGVYLTARNYAPVRNLQTTVETTLADNRQLHSKINEQGEVLRELRLSRLLEGKQLEQEELDEVERFLGSGGRFTVAYIQFRSGVELTAETRAGLTAMYRSLEFEGGRGYGVELHHEDAVAFIVKLHYEAEGKRKLVMQLGDLNEKARAGFQVEPAIGIGGICRSLQELHRSYVEAKGVLQYFPHQQDSRAAFFDEYFTHSEEQFWYPLEEQVRYSQSLLQGDAVLAEESIRQMFATIASKDHSLEMVRYIYYDIINLVIKTVNKLQADRFQDDIRTLLKFHSAEQLESQLLRLSRKLCEYALEEKNKKDETLFVHILDWIGEHYQSPDMSLDHAARQFGMTPSYLSKLFKQETGESFSDHLKALRFGEFKKALVDTNRSIKELVSEVGYWDVSSFTRAFKQQEGMTPGEYRKLHKQ